MTNHPVVLDVDGEELAVGDRVRSRRGVGTVSTLISPSPPVVRVARKEAPAWFSTSVVAPNTYRCPDLRKINDLQPTEREGDA